MKHYLPVISCFMVYEFQNLFAIENKLFYELIKRHELK